MQRFDDVKKFVFWLLFWLQVGRLLLVAPMSKPALPPLPKQPTSAAGGAAKLPAPPVPATPAKPAPAPTPPAPATAKPTPAPTPTKPAPTATVTASKPVATATSTATATASATPPAPAVSAAISQLITTALSSSDIQFCQQTLSQASAAGVSPTSDDMKALKRKTDIMIWQNRVEQLFGSRVSLSVSDASGSGSGAGSAGSGGSTLPVPPPDATTQTALTEALRQAETLGIPKSDVYVMEAAAQLARGEARTAIIALCSVPVTALHTQTTANARSVLSLATGAQLPATEIKPIQTRLQQLVTREKLAKAANSSDVQITKAALSEAKECGIPTSDDAFAAASLNLQKLDALSQVTVAVTAAAAGSRPPVDTLKSLLALGEQNGLSEQQLTPLASLIASGDLSVRLDEAIQTKQIDILSKAIADVTAAGGASGVDPQRLADANTLLASLTHIYEARQRTDVSVLSGALQLAEHMGLDEQVLALKNRIEYLLTHQKLADLLEAPNLDGLTAVFAHIETLPVWMCVQCVVHSLLLCIDAIC